jgi:hypothetical protein
VTPLEIVLAVVLAAQTGLLWWSLATRRPSGVERVLAAQAEALATLAHRGMNAALVTREEQGARVWREEETDARIGENAGEPVSTAGGLSAGFAAPPVPMDGKGRPYVGMP